MKTAMQELKQYILDNLDKIDLEEIIFQIDNYYIHEEKSMLLDFYIQNTLQDQSLYKQIIQFEELYKFFYIEKPKY